MTTPDGHRVVTVERQGGFAARCEVTVDEQTLLCGITFGGFDTRAEARAAIRHLSPAALAAETKKAVAARTATAEHPRKDTHT